MHGIGPCSVLIWVPSFGCLRLGALVLKSSVEAKKHEVCELQMPQGED